MTQVQQKNGASKADIDALLQDTYLRVVELRYGTGVHSSPELWPRCVADVEHVRASLQEDGLDSRSIELISHAQCALLDETVLACAEGKAHEDWAMETLQARFFSSHQAGESLYEDMRTVLREASAHPDVFTVFQRVLMLGFLGRYRDVNHPERQQLLAAIDAHVTPLDTSQSLVTHVGGTSHLPMWGWLKSPLVHGLAASGLLVGLWWGLDHTLGEAVASLLPVKR
ncbi:MULTISPECIES: type VI secretion system protein TssL, short form [Pseudomonas]|uniref:type VI secretion system protein TssL, short form n=1 Tax=Pseudomonas TaxID=286 RepID=UPI0011AAB92A|nr:MULTISPECIES: type VI secretion system protein TssL, short form [Pseudomonas]MBI6926777.1 DotU family type IV/VI secretion system protein [Pseudomonas putida]